MSDSTLVAEQDLVLFAIMSLSTVVLPTAIILKIFVAVSELKMTFWKELVEQTASNE